MPTARTTFIGCSRFAHGLVSKMEIREEYLGILRSGRELKTELQRSRDTKLDAWQIPPWFGPGCDIESLKTTRIREKPVWL